MGILHELDKQKGVVFVVWDGVVQWADWREHAATLMTDPDWFATSRFLVDLRPVASTASISPQEVEEASILFSRNRESLANKRGAVIAAAEFSNASRFESLIADTGVGMAVFNTLDTACIFLGLDMDYVIQHSESLRSRLREKV